MEAFLKEATVTIREERNRDAAPRCKINEARYFNIYTRDFTTSLYSIVSVTTDIRRMPRSRLETHILLSLFQSTLVLTA